MAAHGMAKVSRRPCHLFLLLSSIVSFALIFSKRPVMMVVTIWGMLADFEQFEPTRIPRETSFLFNTDSFRECR
jgi:hypothetical protein